MTQTINRQCTLCEAHCGIQVEVEGERVVRISGDPDDVLSRGYICPKAAALADLQSDPDRLRRPVKKVGGRFVEIGWEEALSLAADGLLGVRERHGADAVATYLGNPGAHSSGIFMAVLVRKLLGSRNNYSATSVDQLPAVHELAGDVRPLRGAADPRRRTHPAHARDRRQPGRLERLDHDRARRCARRSRRSARGAGRWS